MKEKQHFVYNTRLSAHCTLKLVYSFVVQYFSISCRAVEQSCNMAGVSERPNAPPRREGAASFPLRPHEDAHQRDAANMSTYEFDMCDKPMHDYVRTLSRAVVTYQKLEKLETDRQTNEALLRSVHGSGSEKMRHTAEQRVQSNAKAMADASAELSRSLQSVRLPQELQNVVPHGDQSSLHAKVLEEVSNLQKRFIEVKACLDARNLPKEAEDGEIVEKEDETTNEDTSASLGRNMEGLTGKITQRLGALEAAVERVEGQLRQKKDDYQSEINACVNQRVQDLSLQSPLEQNSLVQAQAHRLEQLEANLAAAKAEVHELRKSVTTIRTRAETAEAECELLRGKNAILQEANEYLQRELQEMQTSQQEKTRAMHDEIEGLSAIVVQLANQPPAPVPDLERLVEAILPYAREAVRDDIAAGFSSALGETQLQLQANQQEVLNRLMPKLNLTAEFARTLDRIKAQPT